MAAPSLACRGFGQPALLLRGEHAGEELRCRRWGLHPWRARQADHPRTIAKTRAANIAASSATKGCKEGVAACQRWFQRVERKWVIIRGDVNHGPTGQLAELWRLRPSPGRSIGRPLRCGVFHIGSIDFALENLKLLHLMFKRGRRPYVAEAARRGGAGWSARPQAAAHRLLWLANRLVQHLWMSAGSRRQRLPWQRATLPYAPA